MRKIKITIKRTVFFLVFVFVASGMLESIILTLLKKLGW